GALGRAAWRAVALFAEFADEVAAVARQGAVLDAPGAVFAAAQDAAAGEALGRAGAVDLGVGVGVALLARVDDAVAAGGHGDARLELGAARVEVAVGEAGGGEAGDDVAGDLAARAGIAELAAVDDAVATGGVEALVLHGVGEWCGHQRLGRHLDVVFFADERKDLTVDAV